MAEKPASERTEKPTEERLRRARAEGQVAQSQEVPSALMIAIMLVTLGLAGSGTYHWMAGQMQQGLSFEFHGPMSSGSFVSLLTGRGWAMLSILMPFFISAVVVSILGSVVVGGVNFSTKALSLKLENLSPFKGLGSLFSLRSLAGLVIAIVKMVVIGVIVWNYLKDRLQEILVIGSGGVQQIVIATSQLVLGAAGRITVFLVIIAAADWIFQWWRYRSDLMMTRQEAKEEHEEHELPSEVKGRMRSMMMSLSKKRMLSKVRTADVVITNPTHVAVAIRYESGKMAAPVVVAKGADFLAAKIKELAQANGVAIVEKPPLARMLYATVELDQPVPETLFVAVAEVLAMIYRLKRRRQITR
ncbi:MAG: flagellar biosynthesis protein FlhB [Phycisphaerae bacterium]|jgi:flagellar biosynthetic protein FlhB